jgi:hypothetical protein
LWNATEDPQKNRSPRIRNRPSAQSLPRGFTLYAELIVVMNGRGELLQEHPESETEKIH